MHEEEAGHRRTICRKRKQRKGGGAKREIEAERQK
jgi:hypothetical protein